MRHPIDPTVDCVFKAILGSPHHTNLLINFINAMLDLDGPARVVDVTIINPYNPEAFLKGKLSVVDVKAMDGHRRIFQVDIQIRTRTDLPARILYNWASIYTLSLKKGEHYHRLAPVISIWLLVDNLFPKVEIAHIPFFLFSREAGIQLTDHCQVHLIQLKKWRWNGSMINDKARWLRFFKEGERLDPANLPQWMRTAEMQEAMDIVTAFAKEKENHFAYLSRMDRKRVAWTLQAENDDLSEALQAAQTQIKAKQADMDRLRAERDRLKAQLIDAGLDPVGG